MKLTTPVARDSPTLHITLLPRCLAWKGLTGTAGNCECILEVKSKHTTYKFADAGVNFLRDGIV